MKNKTIVSAILFLMSFIATAQDIIFKNDRTEVKSKILEVEENDIKYKKFEFLDGPTYTMSKSDIYMIIYKNGQKEIFEKKPELVSNTNLKENNTSTTVSGSTANATQSKTASEFTIKKFSFGLSDLGVTINNLGDYTIPNISYNEDMILRDNIALSYYGSFYYINTEDTYSGINIKSNAFNVSFGLGGKYYFNEVLKLDPAKFHIYSGATIGYSSTSFSSESNSNFGDTSTSGSTGDVLYFGQIGGRYFFHNSWGIKTELQFGKGDTAILLGLSYKFIPKGWARVQ